MRTLHLLAVQYLVLALAALADQHFSEAWKRLRNISSGNPGNMI